MVYPPEVWAGNEPALQASLTSFEKALALDPGNRGAREHTAELAMALHRDELALSALGPAAGWSKLRSAKWVTGQPLFHLATSRAFEKSGALCEARAEALTSLHLAHFRFDARREHDELNRIARLSETLARESAPTGQGRSEASYAAVVDAACAGDWESAMRGVRQLTPRLSGFEDAQRAVIWGVSAFCAHASGDMNGEAAALQHVGAVEKTQWTIGDPYLWLGKTLAAEGLDRCSPGPLAIYERYSREHEDSAQGPYLEAELHYWRGDMRRAAVSSLQGMRRDPGHTANVFVLAVSYEGLQDWAAAETAYRAGVTANPASGILWARLGRLLHDTGRLYEADAALRRAIALNPSSAEFLTWRGAVAIDLGDAARARRYFEQAVTADPGNADARQWLTRLRGLPTSGNPSGPH
jgi:tetratricopeptide (TPR) repeat protein